MRSRAKAPLAMHRPFTEFRGTPVRIWGVADAYIGAARSVVAGSAERAGDERLRRASAVRSRRPMRRRRGWEHAFSDSGSFGDHLVRGGRTGPAPGCQDPCGARDPAGQGQRDRLGGQSHRRAVGRAPAAHRDDHPSGLRLAAAQAAAHRRPGVRPGRAGHPPARVRAAPGSRAARSDGVRGTAPQRPEGTAARRPRRRRGSAAPRVAAVACPAGLRHPARRAAGPDRGAAGRGPGRRSGAAHACRAAARSPSAADR